MRKLITVNSGLHEARILGERRIQTSRLARLTAERGPVVQASISSYDQTLSDLLYRAHANCRITLRSANFSSSIVGAQQWGLP
jgi:hypothetical protein